MSEMWVLGFGAAIAGLIQGISGFAFSMVAMSIWVWGVDPQLAAVMAVFGGFTGQVISVLRVRRGWHVSILWPFVVGSLFGIPIGTQLLALLDPNRFKLVLGAMLVVCCSAMLATANLPAIRRGGTVRYLPARAWSRLTAAQRAATNRKKLRGSRSGRQFVANTPTARRASRSTRRRSRSSRRHNSRRSRRPSRAH